MHIGYTCTIMFEQNDNARSNQSESDTQNTEHYTTGTELLLSLLALAIKPVLDGSHFLEILWQTSWNLCESKCSQNER